jgi:CIC family chloride channel protein
MYDARLNRNRTERPVRRIKNLTVWLLVGALGGAVAIGAREFIVWFGAVMHGGVPPMDWGTLPWWRIFAPLVLGGLVVGLIGKYDWELISGAGLDDTLQCYHCHGARQRPLDTPVKLSASLLGLGCGISGGLMGPMTYVGMGVGGWIGRAFRFDADGVRTAGLCGMAATLAAILGAPLGAAIFTCEVLFHDHFEYRRFFPVLLAALTAYLLTRLAGFYQPIFSFNPTATTGISLELIGSVLAVVVVGLAVAAGFFYLYRLLERLRERSGMPRWLSPALGALASALLVVLVAPEAAGKVLSVGATTIRTVGVSTPVAWTDALLLTALKAVLVALAVGSGASVGLLAPALMLGSLVGAGAADLIPVQQTILVATGITVVLVTLTNSPVGTIVMMLEIFGPEVLIPVTLAGLVANLASRRLVIYRDVLPWRSEVPDVCRGGGED